MTELALQQISKTPSAGRRRRFAGNMYVWHRGDKADRLYILQRGRVQILSNSPAGTDRPVRVINAGQPFGELCFCTEVGGTREDSARATAESQVVELDFARLITHIQESSAALSELIGALCTRLGEADRLIEALSYRSAELRLGRLLIHLATSKDKTDAARKGNETLPQSHEELALMAAMSRSHVSVTMGKLRKKGVVEYGRGNPLKVHIEQMRAFLDQSQPSEPEKD